MGATVEDFYQVEENYLNLGGVVSRPGSCPVVKSE